MERFGIRLQLIGKSVVLYRLLSELVTLPFLRIVVLDGKRDALSFVRQARPEIEYFSKSAIYKWSRLNPSQQSTQARCGE